MRTNVDEAVRPNEVTRWGQHLPVRIRVPSRSFAVPFPPHFDAGPAPATLPAAFPLVGASTLRTILRGAPMKHVMETGTDAAGICVFDPMALPADFDDSSRNDPIGQLEQLANAGHLWWCNTGGDGSYLVQVHVDEEVPQDMRAYLHDPQRQELFRAPSGVVWACGIEYIARDPTRGHAQTPKGGLGRHPHMGGPCEVAPGDYTMTAWRAEWPDDMVERELEKQFGKRSTRSGNRLGIATGVLLFATFATAIITLGLTIGALRNFREKLGELAFWWGGLFVLAAITLGLVRALTRREQNPLRREVEHRFPNIVVQLRRREA